MRILVVATKAPWPPIDGGRLILLKTIEALTAQGNDVTLVAPVGPEPADEVTRRLAERCEPHLVESPPRGLLASSVAAEVARKPVTVVRHAHERVRRAVDALVRRRSFDVVHVEQQQALFGAGPAFLAGLRIVLRAHNVESLLWSFAAAHRMPLMRWWLRREARRLKRWEAGSLRRVDRTVALTTVDAAELAGLVGSKEAVTTVEAPFDGEMPALHHRLAGDPAAVILASGSWRPNRDAVWRFAAEVWPVTVNALPGARLHVFGVPAPPVARPGIEWHPPPEESVTAFPEGAVVVVPERHATGVPMKCLESWARGLPIVGCSTAAEQLNAADGEAMLIADGAGAVTAAFERLMNEPDLRKRLVDGGRSMLRRRHDPAAVARRLIEVYSSSSTPPRSPAG